MNAEAKKVVELGKLVRHPGPVLSPDRDCCGQCGGIAQDKDGFCINCK